MVGADICGFIFDTTEELCARWIEVGAFYPFSRNHNTLGAAPQELYLWPSVAEASRKVLNFRYKLLPYMYSLFAQAHSSGATVARPLWMNFPQDPAAVTIDNQFMLGPSIMVSPVLTQGAKSVQAYFPQALWYPVDLSTGVVSYTPLDFQTGPATVTLDTPLTETNVHVRGGSIIPMQQSAMTTTAARATPFSLLVALCQKGHARGGLFWDDGEQVEVEQYLSVSYSAMGSGSTGSVSSTVSVDTYSGARDLKLDTIVVMGPDMPCPSSATLNGVSLSMSTSFICERSASTDSSITRSRLTFNHLGLQLSEPFTLLWE